MENEKKFTGPAYEFEAKMPLKQAIPLGLQHVRAMFVGNLARLLIITGACVRSAARFRLSWEPALVSSVYSTAWRLRWAAVF